MQQVLTAVGKIQNHKVAVRRQLQLGARLDFRQDTGVDTAAPGRQRGASLYIRYERHRRGQRGARHQRDHEE